MNDSARIISAWEATFARRWHRDPHMAETVDPVGGHQGRVALLALMLFPTRHALHRAAIIHDLGEMSGAGDVPANVKRDNPLLAAECNRLEADAIAAMGLPDVSLDATETDMLTMCDRLDAWLWVRHHKPELLARSKWKRDTSDLVAMLWRHQLAHIARELMGVTG